MKKTLSLLICTFLGLAAYTQRIEVSTGLPGALGTLSTGNGTPLTNVAIPITTWYTNGGESVTHTIPSNTKLVIIEAITSGGPGGSGAVQADGVAAGGGGGGQAGNYVRRVYPYSSSLWWTNKIVFTVPASRPGAVAQTSDNSNGNAGTGSALFIVYLGSSSAASNILVTTPTGAQGLGGTSTGGGAGGSGAQIGDYQGQTGGAGSITGTATAGVNSIAGPTGGGGGGGGGVSTANVPLAGGNGGSARVVFTTSEVTLAGGAGGTNGTGLITGVVPQVLKAMLTGTWGASGGGGSTNSNGGAGGDGVYPGQPGGGGGGARNGYDSGAGGAGAGGAVVITTMCSFPAIAFSDWVGFVAQWTYDTVSFLRHLAIPEIEFNSNEVTQ